MDPQTTFGYSSGRHNRAELVESTTTSNVISTPKINLPQGGGAIKAIDEKFQVNTANGTAGLSIPFPFSPSRNSFMPAIILSYNSGSGNGLFGLGWNADPPSITRKTEKKLPQYLDAEESDVFIFSGAEDLVPALKQDISGDWSSDENGRIKRYKPRIEGGFARIERVIEDDGNTYWRVTSRDNVVSIFGKSKSAQIFDPHDESKIFQWQLEFSCDDKGSCYQFEYKKEDKNNVPNELYEKNRLNEFSKCTNAYLKRVKYCNKKHFRRDAINYNDWHNILSGTEYLLELVLDYGEHDLTNPKPNDDTGWLYRRDAFSDYRSGFEIRTYRLCRRVLMFHHFPELGNQPCLVRSIDFEYNEGTAFTFLKSVTQKSYVRKEDAYAFKGLPPVEFTYEPLGWDTEIKSLPKESLENLPVGIDDQTYQWLDLYNEGLSGILTEQGGAWYYKSNRGNGIFDPVELVSPKPSINGLSAGAIHFQDLEGNGQKQLVSNDLQGYFELNGEYEWESFRSFREIPNIDLQDPNLRYIDLDGDGRADILISEDNVFTWYASKGKLGFDDYAFVRKNRDEEKGPAVVFADGTQSIVLADMCGDGLMAIVRIRNSEIVYWPNLGFGKFGAKVTMGNAPVFDYPDCFNPRYVKLADLDGSGTTDIVYLGKDSFKIYFNQSGNSWSEENIISGINPIPFPKFDNATNVHIIDLLGDGTGCIVWSSPLPGYAQNPLRYIDLMGGRKPHIMTGYKNNFGKEVSLEYKPSTYYYLQDKTAGKPCVTKLPFPVQVVSKVVATDKWRQTKFSNQYSYHHGYYDQGEREFRGFGRVDQTDVESFGKFRDGNSSSPFITDDFSLYQPPVLTRTWFHTGAFLEKEKILTQFEHEYFAPSSGEFQENKLPEPDLADENLSVDEWREALRCCKGMVLRQEVYELDVDELERNNFSPVKFFSAAFHNCHIKLIQPKNNNRHAVFLVTESEAITYNYELDLRQHEAIADPRISHTINLVVDELGNVLQSVQIVYPRVGRHVDEGLPSGAEELIAKVQQERHIISIENSFTNDVVEGDNYRLRMPCEVKTYELTGITPATGFYFTLKTLRSLNPVSFETIPYHNLPDYDKLQKRLVENVRILYFKDDLGSPEPPFTVNALGIPYETYTLALTNELLSAIIGEKLDGLVEDGETNDTMLNRLLTEGGYHHMDGMWWVRSGIVGFAPDASSHFYLPEKYTDAFGNSTVLQFDDYDLFIKSSDDPVGNHTEVKEFDYRILAPSQMKDLNDNVSEVLFDILGIPAAMALKGKGAEADDLINVQGELDNDEVQLFFTGDYDESVAKNFLGTATARYVYYLGEEISAGSIVGYAAHPACAAVISREKHVTQPGGNDSPIQIAFQYSDGMGAVLCTKAKAEPKNDGGDIRWVTNGKTIINNKGKPVKQYEPTFSTTHAFKELDEEGAAVTIYYDAPGRTIRTEMPDGSYNRIEFNPWYNASYDANDTVLEQENKWYEDYHNPADEEKHRAAILASVHANTPVLTFLDTLGRDVISITHNKWKTGNPLEGETLHEAKYLTYTKLDTEGKPLWIQDPRGNRVMQYIFPFKPDNTSETEWNTAYSPCYNIAGNLLFQHSMDGGDRWMLNDCTGKPMYSWDSRQHRFFTEYDALRRPIKSWLFKENTNENILVGFEIYGDSLDDIDRKEKNLRGKLYQHYDQSGCITNERFDFKGNLQEVKRSLTKEIKTDGSYQEEINWDVTDTAALLEEENFTQKTLYDALNRMQQLDSWHSAAIPASIYVPEYNERGVLKAEKLYVRGQIKEPPESNYIINGISYDAKGQKQKVVYGNNTVTTYDYDEKTFRLTKLRTTGKIVTDDNMVEIKVLQDLSYVYDPVGNITYIRNDAQQTIFFRNQVVEPHCHYEYDAIYQLVKAQGREHNGQAGTPPDAFDAGRTNIAHPGDGRQMGNYTEYYDYDGAGNILKMRHYNSTNPTQNWVRQYQYDLYNNRLIATGGSEKPNEPFYSISPTLIEKYPYNEHGSMEAMPHLQQMDWDFTEHLQHITKGTQQAWYRYDATKQRSRKTVEDNGKIKERIYLGGFEIYREWNGETLTEQNETIQLVDGAQRMILIDHITQSAEFTAETLLYRYQYSNHLGSASLEIDENNNIISYEEYHPYGTTAYHAVNGTIKTTAKRYRYTGMERDEESGLNYHHARYYANWLGRWSSVDPKLFGGGMNFYRYADSAPNCKVDINGMDPRHIKGEIGELIVDQFLDAQGLYVFRDWDKPVNQGGFDSIAYDPVKDEVYWVDNKANKGYISKADALEKNFVKNRENAIKFLETQTSPEAKAALQAIEKNREVKLIANGMADPTAKASQGIFARGMKFLDVRTGKMFSSFLDYSRELMNIKLASLAASQGLKVKQGGFVTIGGMGFIAIATAAGVFLVSEFGLNETIKMAASFGIQVGVDTILTKLAGSTGIGLIASFTLGLCGHKGGECELEEQEAKIDDFIKANFPGLSPWDTYCDIFTCSATIRVLNRPITQEYRDVYNKVHQLIANPYQIESTQAGSSGLGANFEEIPIGKIPGGGGHMHY